VTEAGCFSSKFYDM